MISIPFYWWMIPAALVITPFIYEKFRKPGGDWDFHIDVILLSLGCWIAALSIMIGYLIGRVL